MRLVFVGPPASGKGTQANIVCLRLQIPGISTGDMLRAAKAEGRLPVDLVAKMALGALVPDDVVIRLIADRTTITDCARGFLLDGFPRTGAQAQALDEMLIGRAVNLDAAVAIEVPRELLIERAVFRRTDKRTGQIYHLKYKPPPPDADLEHRADDREDVVIRRLDTFDEMKAELLPYYESSGKLLRINGVGSVEEVTSRIFSALETRAQTR
jgi:adenylate kinase